MTRVVVKAAYGASVGFAILLASCSGMHSSSIPGSGAEAKGFARATFLVHWPSAQREASARGRNAISPSTASISIAVNGGSPQVVNKPTLTGSPTTTSVSINAPVGVDSFTFLAWDRAGGVGNILDKATTSQDIVANATNAVGVTLDGVCAALIASVSPSPYLQAQTSTVPIANGGTQTVLAALRLDGPLAQTVTINEVDPDGNTIVNSAGTVPIALNESGSTAHVTIAPVTTSAGNNAFTLTPIAAEADGVSTTITASSQQCGTGLTGLPNAFAISTSAIVYVADQSAGIIAYDQDGNELSKIATTSGITGMTYNTSSNSLVAVEPKSATTGGVVFQSLSLTGSSLGSGSLVLPSGLTNPVGNIAYNPANGYVLVGFREYTDASSNTHYGSVLEYTISGSSSTAVKPTGTNPFQTSTSTPPPYDVDSFAIYPNGNVVVGDSMTNSYYYDKNGNYLNYEGYSALTLAFDTLRGNVIDFPAAANYAYVFNSTGGYIERFNFPGLENDTTINATAAAYNPGPDYLYAFIGKSSFAIPAAGIYENGQPVNVLAPGAFPGLTAPTQALVVQ